MVNVYDRLQNNLSKTIGTYNDLANSKDPELKKYRFGLQKMINTPVNAISAESGEHLIDKITRLRKVLMGQQVEVTGRTLSVNQHPQAKLYCCNLLARKLLVRNSVYCVALRITVEDQNVK